MINNIAIIGGGAWGTALAHCIALTDKTIRLWAREPEVVETISKYNENKMFLPGIKLHSQIKPSSELLTVTKNSDVVILVVPSQYFRHVSKELMQSITDETPIIICTKGIETGTGLLMSEIISDFFPQNTIATLSGPTFASEVALGKPTALAFACGDKNISQKLLEVFSKTNLRPYISDDIVGAEIGGAVKNVIAIASGVTIGRGLGDNARASLITRGFAEMLRLALAKGAKKETLTGLSGLGDLLLTCTSYQSRNFSLGVELGKGKKLEEVVKTRRAVTEGVANATAVVELSKKCGIEMPIANAVAKILQDESSIEQAIKELLARPVTTE
ncbi:MAG: glycerol-3-phosphate acyltransferase [Gammaproteobacteria bacterium]|nr:glycerol-3-phosphate acyltransferase [Gammaproteobacteria bacterium]